MLPDVGMLRLRLVYCKTSADNVAATNAGLQFCGPFVSGRKGDAR